MKIEINILNNKNLKQDEIERIIYGDWNSSKINLINKDFSDLTKKGIFSLKDRSKNIVEYVNNLQKVLNKTNVYKGVEVIEGQSQSFSIFLKRKDFFNCFVTKDFACSLSLYNLFTDFSVFESQIGLKPQFNNPNLNLNNIRTDFIFRMPLNNFNSDTIISLFNRNKHFLSVEDLEKKNSLKGIQISNKHHNLALYSKEAYEYEKDESNFKFVARYRNPHLFVNNLKLDVKSSLDNNIRNRNTAQLSYNKFKSLKYKKGIFIVGNKTNLVYDSDKLDLSKNKYWFNFKEETDKTNIVLNNNFRVSAYSKVGSFPYFLFGFWNLLAYNNKGKADFNSNVGIGLRVKLIDDLYFESLFNIDWREKQKPVIFKFKYKD